MNPWAHSDPFFTNSPRNKDTFDHTSKQSIYSTMMTSLPYWSSCIYNDSMGEKWDSDHPSW